ncbi:MAG: DUF1684 domain-containing protein [Acidimicrobiia bacterium]
MTIDISAAIALAGYRAAVAGLYERARAGDDPPTAWQTWRHDRDHLLRTHPQSPVADRPDWPGSPFFAYDASWRLLGAIVAAGPTASISVAQRDGTTEHFDPIGSVQFSRENATYSLPLYWTRGYSGGLFLPFGDATNGITTAGSGRYLVDQAKSAFLGLSDECLVLDFNFAYHPSCVWGDWLCPLPRPESRLPIAVAAGERLTFGQV